MSGLSLDLQTKMERDACEARGLAAEFDRMVETGCTPQFAAMCLLRQAPGTKGTDRALMQGDVLNHGLADMPVWLQEMHVAKAKAAGISIAGKVYKGGLADGRGPADPAAWVGGVDDVLEVARKRDLHVYDGVVTHTPVRDIVPKPDVPLAPKLVEGLVNDYLQADPGLAAKPRQELREMVIDKHGARAAWRSSGANSVQTEDGGTVNLGRQKKRRRR